ncbi:MAG: hypothetical protein AAF512_24095, partial [Pseudomonadota bacterium]
MVEFNVGFIPIAMLMLLVGFAVYILPQVSREISRERFNQVEDLENLWRNGSIPPVLVLTEKGRQYLYWIRVMMLLMILFVLIECLIVIWFFLPYESEFHQLFIITTIILLPTLLSVVPIHLLSKKSLQEVSQEKLKQVDDLSLPWSGMPPDIVLTDKGRKLRFWSG